MNKCFLEGLDSPSSAYSQSPFWFLNDQVDGEIYVRQLEEMAKKGVMQVTPHPRYGMDRREYLSDRYLDAFEQMVSRAGELGMTVQLYDEFNWSSGPCGGRVTADRRLCALGLAMNSKRVSGGKAVTFDRWVDGFEGWAEFEEILLTAMAPPLSATALDFERMFTVKGQLQDGRLTVTVPDGDWVVFVLYTVRTIHPSPLREGNGGIIDYLSEEPVRAFLQSTHEVYRRRLEGQLGSTIRSVFSDEVGPYACGDFTWSNGFADYFRQKKGYDLLPLLPMLYFDGDPRAPKVRCDYWDTVTTAFQEHFLRPIADWCRTYSLVSTGHTFEESRLWPIAGNMYESMRSQGWVGVDSLQGYKPYSMIKPCISAAHATGRREAVCEAAGVLGEELGPFGSWTCAPRQLKFALNQLGIAGVTMVVLHAFFQSVDNPKAECPPSFFLDNPWWRYYEDMERLTRRICYINRETTHAADLAVVYPIVSWWSRSRGGRGRGGPASIPRAQEIDSFQESDGFDRLIDELMRRQLDYDVLDLQALEDSRVEEGQLLLWEERYRVVILPPMSCVPLRLLQRLLELAEQRVPLFCTKGFSPIASMERGEGDEELQQLMTALRPHLTTARDAEELEKLLRSRLDCDITLLNGSREALDAAHRRTEGLELYLLSNLRDQESRFTLRLRCEGTDCALLDSLGHPLPVTAIFSPGAVTVPVTLPPEELCCLLISEASLPERYHCREKPLQTLELPALQGGWLFTPVSSMDGLFAGGALTMQQLSVPVGRTIAGQEPPADETFYRRWIRPDFDDSDWQPVSLLRDGALFSHKSSQYFRFVIPAGACALALPFPSDCEFALWVNGTLQLQMLDFQKQTPRWLPLEGCEDAPGLLAVETASMRPGFGLTGPPVFLIKPFRTTLKPWSSWGIDWYSGFGVYERRIRLPGPVHGKLWLELGEVRECCEVRINGRTAGQRIWPPYRIEIGRLLQPGDNLLQIAVCNLMSNQYQWDVLGSRGTGRRLLSGLLGPVKLSVEGEE